MSDASGGYMPGGQGDRLSAMRAPTAAGMSRAGSPARKMRVDLLVGVILILGGLAFALYVRGGATTAPVTSVAGEMGTPVTPADSGTLLAGEVAVAFAVDDGNYPPSLRVGDEVRLIVTPGLDGTGDVRPIADKTVVLSIDAPTDNGNKRVITVRAPEAVASAVAASGPVHVVILGGVAS